MIEVALLQPLDSQCMARTGTVGIYKEFNIARHSKQHVQKVAFSSYPGEGSSEWAASDVAAQHNIDP